MHLLTFTKLLTITTCLDDGKIQKFISRKLINTITYVVETQKVLHTSGKSWHPISYASVVNKGWNYLDQSIRIGRFSNVNWRPSFPAFHICFLFFGRTYSPERSSSSWLWNAWGCMSMHRGVDSSVLQMTFPRFGALQFHQESARLYISSY